MEILALKTFTEFMCAGLTRVLFVPYAFTSVFTETETFVSAGCQKLCLVLNWHVHD